MLNCGIPLAPRNLLDNSDFRNPVNQRGITSQVGGGYGLDRWRADGSGTISVESTGVSLTNLSFRQPVSLKAGTYTLAFKVSNGELLYYNFTYDGTSTITKIGGRNEITGAYINLYNQSNGVIVCQFVLGPEYIYTLVWAALYEGSYDASTLPPYVPKGYAAELAECQRYYVHCGEANWMTGMFKVGEGLIVEIPTANKIRTSYPTIIVNSPKVFTTNGWYDITYSSCAVTKCWTKLLFNFPEEANQFISYYGVYIITGIVGISADL